LPGPTDVGEQAEEAGVGKCRHAPLWGAAMGRLQNAAGRSAEICTKPPRICNDAMQ